MWLSLDVHLNKWRVVSTSTVNPDERTFTVDSGASMHMMSKSEVTPEELETVTVSRLPTTLITPNGSVQTTKESTDKRERFGQVRHCPTPRIHCSNVISGRSNTKSY